MASMRSPIGGLPVVVEEQRGMGIQEMDLPVVSEDEELMATAAAEKETESKEHSKKRLKTGSISDGSANRYATIHTRKDSKTVVMSSLKMANSLRDLARNEESHEHLIGNSEILEGIVNLLRNKNQAVGLVAMQTVEFLAMNPANREKLRKFQGLLEIVEELTALSEIQGVQRSAGRVLAALVAKRRHRESKLRRKAIRTRIELKVICLKSDEIADELRLALLKVEGVVSVTFSLESKTIIIFCRKDREEMIGKLQSCVKKFCDLDNETQSTISSSSNREYSSYSSKKRSFGSSGMRSADIETGGGNSNAYEYQSSASTRAKLDARPKSTVVLFGEYEDPDRAERRKRALKRRQEAQASYLGSIMRFFF